VKSPAPNTCVRIVLGLLSFAILADAHIVLASTWTPEDAMKVKKITSVQVSPDGTRIMYVASEPQMNADPTVYISDLYLANYDGSELVRIQIPWKASCEDPQWSPDGKWIAFVATRGGVRILLVRASDAATANDPVPVSERGASVTSYKWSPRGDRICYTAYLERSDDRAKDKSRPLNIRAVDEILGESHLYVAELATNTLPDRKASYCTPSTLSISGLRQSGYDWSPDGKRIVMSGARSARANDWHTARLAICNPSSTELVHVANNSGCAEYSPFCSPDGEWIAYVATDSPPRWAGAGRIALIPMKGGIPRMLSETFDGWSPYSELIGWSRDSKSLYFAEIHGTVTRVGRIPIDGSPPTILGQADGVATNIQLNAGRSHFGFCWETVGTPPEAHVSSVVRFEPLAASKVNHNLPKHSIGRTEVISWKSPDGMRIEGLLTYPVDYLKDKSYPLILNIHGGPQGVFKQSYVPSPGQYPIAVLSGNGYAILRPNPRGSSGYGREFRFANYGDWGKGDFQDLMAGVDYLISTGLADKNRLGVMGWSYGGYMAAWTITQTKRFKAASVGAGACNLVSYVGTTDSPGLAADYFGGEIWDKLDAYRKCSPISSSRA
jgi:dipeptidyl aminopeptidase/acylaminoacyl peptidase